MTSFFKPKPKAPEPEMIQWTTTKAIKGTTARIEQSLKARVGSHVMHTRHGKVTLVGQAAHDKLEIEIQTDTSLWPVPGGIITTREVVDAVECSDPSAVARARDPVVYIGSTHEVIWEEYQAVIANSNAYDDDVRKHYGDVPVRVSTAKGKAKAPAAEKGTKAPKKRGRPKGSKDREPRKLRSATKVAWLYEGAKAPKGRQVAEIGGAVEHDGIGGAILLEQVDLDTLKLQAGEEGSEYAVTVESAKCFAVANFDPSKSSGGSGAGSSGAGGSGAKPKRRKTGGRKRKELTEQDSSRGLSQLSTKAEVDRVAKRVKREEAAEKRGKPLKPRRLKKNRSWPPALKEQAVAIYQSKYAAGEQYEACTQHLLNLPGYAGLSRALLRAWVIRASEEAAQTPNEYGIVVTRAGRPPRIPVEFYEELKATVKNLAQTRAIRVCASSMQPVVRSLIVHRCGTDVIRPGKGNFIVGHMWLQMLAKDAGLRWRKPYGDARKPPPDADAQIDDMRLRLAYLMKRHAIPRALVLNFDHTGLHFMQQRGKTFTAVEEDKEAAHQSREGKQKETKLKGLNDKRQATGTVGTSFAGDVLPGQLIVEGVSTSHQALPDLPACTYAKMHGSNPGHQVGWHLVRHGADASIGRLERQWLGHLTQTSNHWANIPTSYAILEYIIIPWLLAKKASMDLPADQPAILIIDCWYGWKDQDKKKTLQNFRDYVRENYAWLKLLFVPAACTDLVQPADRGMISWLKAFMRAIFGDTISADVLKQLNAGKAPADVTLDVSAPHLKRMLALAFAKALSELPAEKVRHCWAPLQVAYDDMDTLHAKAASDLERLFPNKQVYAPDGNEEEPSSDVEDDFEDPDFEQVHAHVQAQHAHAADTAGALGVPAQRPTRSAATAANNG